MQNIATIEFELNGAAQSGTSPRIRKAIHRTTEIFAQTNVDTQDKNGEASQ